MEKPRGNNTNRFKGEKVFALKIERIKTKRRQINCKRAEEKKTNEFRRETI